MLLNRSLSNLPNFEIFFQSDEYYESNIDTGKGNYFKFYAKVDYNVNCLYADITGKKHSTSRTNVEYSTFWLLPKTNYNSIDKLRYNLSTIQNFIRQCIEDSDYDERNEYIVTYFSLFKIEEIFPIGISRKMIKETYL